MENEDVHKIVDNLTPDEIYQARLIVARNKFWTPEIEKLLRKWRRQVNERYIEHRELERKYSKRFYLLGIPTSVLGTVVATGVIVTFQNCNACTPTEAADCARDQWIRLVMGIIQIISVVFAAISLFMDYGGASGDNKNSAVAYAGLVRRIDTILGSPVSSRDDPIHTLNDIRSQFDDISKNSPTIKATALEYGTLPEGGKPAAPKIGDIDHLNLRSPRQPNKKMPDASSLARILLEKVEEDKRNEETTERHMYEANDYDTDEEKTRDVVIRFDLESMRPEDIVDATKQTTVQDSLARALEFELGRLYTDTNYQKDHLQQQPEEPSVKKKRRHRKHKIDPDSIPLEEIPKDKGEA